jgi:hypothetical protein
LAFQSNHIEFVAGPECAIENREFCIALLSYFGLDGVRRLEIVFGSAIAVASALPVIASAAAAFIRRRRAAAVAAEA